MSQETRDRIVAKGAELIHRQGFNNTGIQEVLDAAGVPKGSFYFYFKSKEDFGLAVVDHFGAQFAAFAAQAASSGEGPALDKLRAFFAASKDLFARAGYAKGCPIGNLAQEMGDLSAPFQERLERAMAGLTGFVAGILAQARDQGELPGDCDVDATAMFIVQAWHGAIIRMKCAKSGQPLDVCTGFIFNNVLAG